MSGHTKTYAQFLRQRGIEGLHGPERKHLQEDLDWCAENPELQVKLDALVGEDVYLLRDRSSMGGEIAYPAGSKMRVLERWMGMLHVDYNGRIVLIVKPEWVSTSPGAVVLKKAANR